LFLYLWFVARDCALMRSNDPSPDDLLHFESSYVVQLIYASAYSLLPVY
jgi:hypothetical protein